MTQVENNKNCTIVEDLINDNYQGNYKNMLVSTISPDNILKCETYGIKIRGFEADDSSADKSAKLLRKMDKYHDVLCGDVGVWYPLIPSSSQIEEEKFGNEKLSKIMKKVHDNEKKDEKNTRLEQEKNQEILDQEEIQKKIEEYKKNEDIEVLQENEEFLFEGQDCLDEDPIIPDKRFAIISLASPELIMNVKERWFKVRGFAHNMQKAMSLINVLQESDKMFNMIIVEVGKWAPVNFKTISQMRKLSVQEREEKQLNDLKYLNEIVGRHKKNLDSRKDIIKQRQIDQITKAASEMDNTPAPVNEDENKMKEEINKNKEGAKDKLRRMIEENRKRKEEMGEVKVDKKEKNDVPLTERERLRKVLEERKKQNPEKYKLQEKKTNLDSREVNIKQEAVRINEQKQNLEELKENKKKLDSRLSEIKAMYAKKMAQKKSDA